ncbi:MAG: acyl-CoA thioesterase [Oscillospiraceae bacterium]|jgi:acyl-CoA thioester hydrolase|nr:acyl-CoA thioesterase [Oscillospiraceae bacterium]
MMKKLVEEIKVKIRFSEVDSMGIVWHGAYVKYFEDVREAFGLTYGLSYLLIHSHGFYAPLVDLSLQYKRPLKYGDTMLVKISYIPTEAAKIIFEYEIRDVETGELCTTGKSVQVFLDSNYQLVLFNPLFYNKWKEMNVMNHE